MNIRAGMVQKLLPFFSLIALFIFLSIASPHFLTAINLSSVIRQTAVINIMALGMTLVIVSGGIDLSVGAILAFAGTMGTMCMVAGRRQRASERGQPGGSGASLFTERPA